MLHVYSLLVSRGGLFSENDIDENGIYKYGAIVLVFSFQQFDSAIWNYIQFKTLKFHGSWRQTSA